MTKILGKTAMHAIGFFIAGLISHALGFGDWWTMIAMTAGALVANITAKCA